MKAQLPGWRARVAAAVMLAAWGWRANKPAADGRRLAIEFNHHDSTCRALNITTNNIMWQPSELNDDDDDGMEAVTAAEVKARRGAILAEFAWSWHAYERYAWSRDELKPLSKTGADWVPGGMGLSILDNLDTLWLMGLDDEYARARSFVHLNLSFAINAEVNTFETTIRALGGLLSAHALTGDVLFSTRALDLGKRLLGAFKTSTQLPAPNVNLKTRKPGHAHWSYDLCTAEMARSASSSHSSQTLRETRASRRLLRAWATISPALRAARSLTGTCCPSSSTAMARPARRRWSRSARAATRTTSTYSRRGCRPARRTPG